MGIPDGWYHEQVRLPTSHLGDLDTRVWPDDDHMNLFHCDKPPGLFHCASTLPQTPAQRRVMPALIPSGSTSDETRIQLLPALGW